MGQDLNPVVVLGGGMTGLGVIRNLGRNGVDVYCALDKKDQAVYSRYCKKYFIIPQISQNKEKLKNFLTKLQSQLNHKAVLFPTSDLCALNVSDLKNETDSYLIPIADRKILETLVEKKKFYQSLSRNGIPHPTTYFSEDVRNCNKINKRLLYPVFLKPSMSQTFSKAFRKKGFVANSEEELLKYMKITEKQGIDPMVQETIPGPATNHYFIDGYLDKNSKPLALFARRRLRMWPPNFGNSTACVSIPPGEAGSLKETIVNYLRSIGFHGIFSAEFKKDPRDNIAKLLEVNARSWWYNSFPAKCGINIVWIAYLDATGKHIEYTENYEENVKLIYILQDAVSTFSMLTKNTLNIKEWAQSLKGKKDYAYFAEDDPLPFIMSFVYAIPQIRRKS